MSVLLLMLVLLWFNNEKMCGLGGEIYQTSFQNQWEEYRTNLYRIIIAKLELARLQILLSSPYQWVDGLSWV